MKTLTQAAQAAKLARRELKEKYPEIKFRITSHNYSMGSTVNIGWNNGPTENAINQIVIKYQYGKFNGMDDSYDYTNVMPNIPQVKHVFVDRFISDTVYLAKLEQLKEKHDCLKNVEDLDQRLPGRNATARQFLWVQLVGCTL
jgi:hypothetical protein